MLAAFSHLAGKNLHLLNQAMFQRNWKLKQPGTTVRLVCVITILQDPCRAIGAGSSEGRVTEPTCLHCHGINPGQFLLGAANAIGRLLLLKQRKTSFLFKLDIAQAFDSVSWPFLLEILQHKGFGPKWCSWLCLMLSSSSTRVPS